MPEQLIEKLAKELFDGTEAGEKLQKAVEIVADIQMGLCAAADKMDEGLLTQIKVGTILALGVFRKALSGKSPGELGKEDWAEILKDTAQLAVCTEDTAYSVFVFRLYAGYIETSVSLIGERISAESANAIRMLENELLEQIRQIEAGDISEIRFTEECLWISLEAMMKLLAAYFGALLGSDREKLSVAITSFAVALARYSLLKREQEQLSGYLSGQKLLDEKLRSEREAFREALDRETERFRALIQNAFAPDFRNALQASACLALEAGVPEEEILHTEEEIDAFFL